MRVEASPVSAAAKLALDIYGDVLDAIRADRLTERNVILAGNSLQISDTSIDLGRFDRILVAGAGKAATGMAQAVDRILGNRIADGLVVTKDGHGIDCGRIRVLEAGHPTPDERSLLAGEAIHDLAQRAGSRDLVLFLLSGGASALLDLLRSPVTLTDLRETTDLLLGAGAPIHDVNAVRACLSLVKAGGVARAAAPATVLCLVLSDVLGNPLEVIGSGPCVDTRADPLDAMEVLRRYHLADRIPAAVRELLANYPAATDAPSRAHHFIIGDIRTAIDAACDSAEARGLRPLVLTGCMEGEARDVGKLVGAIAQDLPATARDTGYDCLVLGGETTVTVRGAGLGGRSQEIACSALERIANVDGVAVLAGSTDGTDGPTDAAGGFVDPTVAFNARRLGLDARKALADNNTLPFLKSTGGLIKTGPTYTNVGDIVLIVYKPG